MAWFCCLRPADRALQPAGQLLQAAGPRLQPVDLLLLHADLLPRLLVYLFSLLIYCRSGKSCLYDRANSLTAPPRNTSHRHRHRSGGLAAQPHDNFLGRASSFSLPRLVGTGALPSGPTRRVAPRHCPALPAFRVGWPFTDALTAQQYARRGAARRLYTRWRDPHARLKKSTAAGDRQRLESTTGGGGMQHPTGMHVA